MIKIIVDSACDLTAAECNTMRLDCVPLTLNFGEEIFLDGVDLKPAEFYEKMRTASVLPTTSQVNPAQFQAVFAKYKNDDILFISLGSALSATMQSAKNAAKMLDLKNIYIVDSCSASLGTALIIREAVRLRDSRQYTAAEIKAKLEELVPHLRLFGIVDTLKNLKQGGRLGGGAALIGEVLGIKPVVQVQDGAVTAIGKVRGEKNGIKKLKELLQSYDVAPEYGIAFANANAEEKMNRYIEYIAPSATMPLYKGSIGSVIGTHAGPGVVAMAFITAK